MIRRKKQRISVRIIAILFGIVGLAAGISRGLIEGKSFKASTFDFLLNAAVDLFGIAVTVLVIDYLNEKHEESYQKDRIQREISSKEQGVALRAVAEAAAREWLFNSALDNAVLIGANLAGAVLEPIRMRSARLDEACLDNASIGKADFQEVNLSGASLKGVIINQANFQGANLYQTNFSEAVLQHVSFDNANLWQACFRGAYFLNCSFNNAILNSADFRGVKNAEGITFKQASELCNAIMPDGRVYNGCYHLAGDEKKAKERGIRVSDSEAMAKFYGIPLTTYIESTNLSSK